MLAIREDLGLQGEKCAAGVDEVHARQSVLEGDLLCPQVLLHRHREVGAALYGGVVGDDHHLATVDRSDPGDDSRCRSVSVVEPVGGERGQLEKCRTRVEEGIDAFARQQFAARGVAPARLLGPPGPRPRQSFAQLGDQVMHAAPVLLETGIADSNLGFDPLHLVGDFPGPALSLGGARIAPRRRRRSRRAPTSIRFGVTPSPAAMAAAVPAASPVAMQAGISLVA